MAADELGATPFKGAQIDKLLECNQKLQELNIDATITLPRIIVIGDQSSGKSSLIEALSLVQVPRAAGRCTPCPLAINLTSDEFEPVWKCRILLERRYDYDPSHSTTEDLSMGHWKPCEPTTRMFKTTTNKKEVCQLIREAQQVILNPRDGTNESTVQFSPNIVKLDISCPGSATLSFIDLPGVIASSEKPSEAHLVPLIDKLVKSYAYDLNTVILLPLPMTNDLANSKARYIIQEIGAEDRTLAVLTKPDRAQNDAYEQYLAKFLGRGETVFDYGWSIVMMGSNTELEYIEARRLEREFFHASEPWKSLDRKYQQRLGVESVRLHLQDLLFQKLQTSLPTNLRSIGERLDIVEGQMQRLPLTPDLSKLPLMIEKVMSIFENQSRKAFREGVAAQESTRLQWATLSQDFRSSLMSSRPRLVLITAEEDRKLKKALDKGETSIIQRPKNPAEVLEISDDDVLNSSTVILKKEIDSKPIKGDGNLDFAHRFKLEHIRNINQQYAMLGMPRQISVSALHDMMAMSVSRWKVPLQTLLSEVSQLVTEKLCAIVRTSFNHFDRLEFFNAVMNFVRGKVTHIFESESERADSFLEVEQRTPYTLDLDSQAIRFKKARSTLTEKRNERRLAILQAEFELDNPRSKKSLGLDVLPLDDYKLEVEMAAQTRGYYEIAASRFADNVCQSLEARLFPTCTEKLSVALRDYIGVERPEKQVQLREWMSEDPDTERQRQALIDERQKLIEGKQYISEALGTDLEKRSLGPPSSENSSSIDTSSTPFSTPSKRNAPQEFETPSKKRTTEMSRLSIRVSPECNGRSRLGKGSADDGDSAFL